MRSEDSGGCRVWGIFRGFSAELFVAVKTDCTDIQLYSKYQYCLRQF